jgi:hypothetical protein
MEHPQGAMPPARPQKIVVRDREIHFFLRGALQDLDISIDHVDVLPVIEEIFDSLQQFGRSAVETLPADWEQAIQEQARRLWDNAPWHHLSDDQILQINLNYWDLESLYVSVLGMAGLEYGLLIYRTLDSLIQFRKTATMDMLSPQQMQQAFLSQDCLFLNFELVREPQNAGLLPLPWMQSAPSEVIPEYGSLHPLEGLRTSLEIQEAAVLQVCLEALNQFFEEHESTLGGSQFPKLSKQMSLPDPLGDCPLVITVSTCPEITAQIEATEEALQANGQGLMGLPRFRDEYVPEGAIILLTILKRELADEIRRTSSYFTMGKAPSKLPALPIVVIQTSRPKARKLVADFQAAGGVQAVCFNSGCDPMTGDTLKLGLIQTGNEDFHLFVEFSEDDHQDSQVLHRWHQDCKKSKGLCGVLIASGVTGTAKGAPGIKEVVAFFEARFRTPEELNIPPLQMSYALEWE